MRERPVTKREFVKILKKLGFSHVRTNASHEHWEHRNFNGERRLVTVDGHHEPFARDLLKSMRSQAGLSRREFMKCLDDIRHCEKVRRKYDPAFD
ncbi:type II toxin-antitoxin system HicA family toxin [Salinicola sp. LHM]|uniref:type II toxin-antitoxin system HicA family toxin n=1 Tax=Salinicola sp. LHM TaxID=3065298 RepID=UPI003A102513